MMHKNCMSMLSMLLLGAMLAGCVAPVAAPSATSAPPVATPLPPTETPQPPTATPVPPAVAPPTAIPAQAAPATESPASEAIGKVQLKSGKITSQALAGNLLGDPTTRKYYVLLPPGYETSDKHYPVVYALHNFTGDSGSEVQQIKRAYEEALQSGDVQEMIFVFPDAKNKLGGSMYLSSPVIGDYETYITQELVELIDATYRTIPDRASRGITGCGMMGGTGSIGMALKHPDVFGAAAPASALYDWENEPLFEWLLDDLTPLPSDLEHVFFNFGDAWYLAMAAAAAPDPNNPPFYVEVPFILEEGKAEIVPTVREKMATSDPVHDIQRYLAQPERLNSLMLYHSTTDDPAVWTEAIRLPPSGSTEIARDFDSLLTAQDINHEYFETTTIGGCQTYHGPVIKFLSDHLAGEPAQ